MGRLKFDFHAGAAYWRGGGSSADEVFDCAVVLAWFALAALAQRVDRSHRRDVVLITQITA